MLGQILNALGLKLQDLALLLGPLAFLSGLVALGVSGNLYRRRWLTRLGWLVAIAGIVVTAVGIFYPSASHAG